MKCLEAGENAYIDYSHVHQPTNPPRAGHFFICIIALNNRKRWTWRNVEFPIASMKLTLDHELGVSFPHQTHQQTTIYNAFIGMHIALANTKVINSAKIIDSEEKTQQRLLKITKSHFALKRNRRCILKEQPLGIWNNTNPFKQLNSVLLFNTFRVAAPQMWTLSAMLFFRKNMCLSGELAREAN